MLFLSRYTFLERYHNILLLALWKKGLWTNLILSVYSTNNISQQNNHTNTLWTSIFINIIVIVKKSHSLLSSVIVAGVVFQSIIAYLTYENFTIFNV